MIAMFGKKKEKSPAALGFSLFNQEGERTAQHAAVSLPLNREAVLEKSIEFFQDPHPCAIHEGAVRMRMLGELEAYLKGKGLVRLSEMPDSLRHYLDLEAEYVYIALDGA